MAVRLFNKIRGVRKDFGFPKYYQTSSALYKILQFNLSDIGEGIREVTVRDWFIKVGDRVSQFDDLCLVESDKASVNITSRFDGVVKKLYYEVGDTALVGKALVDIDIDGEEATASVGEQQQQIENKNIEKTQNVSINKVENTNDREDVSTISRGPVISAPDDCQLYSNKALSTPAVRRIAKENNISLSSIKATGKNGRVLKEDVLRYLDEVKLVPSSNKVFETPRDNVDSTDKIVEITGIKRAMVKSMTKSNSIPTLGYCDEIDLTKLIELRNDVKSYAEKKGLDITYMPFFMKALSKALEEYPLLNSVVDERCEFITYKSQHNIGFAMDTRGGLIVPNIKNVQSLNILEISRHMNRILKDGRELKLGPTDMSGGTITISNIGSIGGTYVRPIINPPEVCILALGRARLTPVFDTNGEVIRRHILMASWSADHRIIDGATIARFSNIWKNYIENPLYLLLDL